MFKRIKNLLNISRYTVDELRGHAKFHEVARRPEETTQAYYERTWGPLEEVPRPAQIINMKAEDPFKELEDDTTK